jgi:GT2 family glycosyltransferase/glycosyltransferase involved in cell wall biosynthesis
MPHHLDPNAARRHRCVLAKIEALARRARAGEDVVAELELVGAVNEILALGFKANKRFPPLAFPDCASPQASIVIPAHDKFETTYHCLAALWLAECAASYEIILVDDGSTDRTREIGGLVSGLRILRNERPLGFVRACNLGAAEARGNYIVLLNNDTEPDGKWLDELIFALRQFPGAGMAGAKLVYPDGELQEAGGIVWRNGNPWNYGRRGNASDPRYNYARQADYLSGAAIMLPAEAWRRVGGFSEEFAPAYFEDTDLAFKLRQIGLKTIYAPLARVVHHEGVSNGVSVSGGMKRHQEINRPKFKRKWAQAFRFSREEGDEPDLAKDRGVTARALVVDISTPRPDIDAGSYAAIQEMRLLQSLGLKATFAPENMAYLGKYTEALQRIGVETIHAPFAFSVREVLEARGAEFDIVYVTRYDLARRLMDDIRRLAPRAKIMFCNADLHFLRELRAMMAKNDPSLMSSVVEIRDAELDVIRRADVTLSYSETEHAVIASHNLNTGRVMTAPWVAEIVEDAPSFAARSGLSFLGGFGHPPNLEAVEHFIRDVMPALRTAAPGICLSVYGSRAPESLLNLKRDGIHVAGYVENVREAYDRARVFVAPLLSGAGVKGKVVGAMAHGVPCVLSPVAAEGIGVRHGHDCLIAETAPEWVAAVLSLHEDEALWRRIASNAREHIRQSYSFERGRRLMRRALEAVGVFAPEEPDGLYCRSASPPPP